MCCQDQVEDICSLSSKADYNLYCILSGEKCMGNLFFSPPLDSPRLCPGRASAKKLIEHFIFIWESAPNHLPIISWTKIPTGNSSFELVSPPLTEPHTVTQFYLCSETGSTGAPLNSAPTIPFLNVHSSTPRPISLAHKVGK